MSKTCPLCDREPDALFVQAHHRYEVWCPWMGCPCDLRGVGQSEAEARAEWDEQVSAVARTVRVNLRVQGSPVPGENAIVTRRCLWVDGEREAVVADNATATELVDLAREGILRLQLGPDEAAVMLDGLLVFLRERESRGAVAEGVPETVSSGAVTKVERL